MCLENLKDKFPSSDIEWRVGRCGVKSDGQVWCMALAYITARAIHDRLDEVVGPENWRNEYRAIHSGVVCGIGIRIIMNRYLDTRQAEITINASDEWVTKWGGADETNMEAYKGMLSGSEKRAGVPWGIGRYLYHLPETFVKTSTKKITGWNYQSANKKKGIPAFWWETPTLPKWALPESDNSQAEPKSNKVEAELVKKLKELKDVLGDEAYEKAKKYCAKMYEAEYKISASATIVRHADTLVDLKNEGKL